MAQSSGQLAEAEQRYSQALAEARADPDSQPLAAMLASRLAGTYTLLVQGEKAMELGQWAVGTGRLDAADASQTRALIAIGASQASGPREALAELAYLDADPARADPIDVDGLAYRGVFRLAAGDLGQAVSDLTASLKMVRRGATLTVGLRAYAYLTLAHYVAGAWDDALLTAGQGLSAATIHLPPLRAAAAPPGRGLRAGRAGRSRGGRAARSAGRGSGRQPGRRPGTSCTRRWPGPWSARLRVTTWEWLMRWAPGVMTRSWMAAAGCTQCCGGRCWPRA